MRISLSVQILKKKWGNKNYFEITPLRRKVCPSVAFTFTGRPHVARYPKAVANLQRNFDYCKNLLENNLPGILLLTIPTPA